MKITKELSESLEGVSEEELKRLLRKHYRAKAEREKNPAHKPEDAIREEVTIYDDNNEIRYAKPKRQNPTVGRESYEGQKTLTDTFGYMPLLDRLLQMQRGGETLAQMRSHMAEYNIEIRKEIEKAAKLHADDWPTAINTYMPDIAELQQMQKDAQYRVAARVKARAEEKYRAEAMGLIKRATDEPPKTPTDDAPNQRGD